MATLAGSGRFARVALHDGDRPDRSRKTELELSYIINRATALSGALALFCVYEPYGLPETYGLP